MLDNPSIAVGAYVTRAPSIPPRASRKRRLAAASLYPAVYRVLAIEGSRALCLRVGDSVHGRLGNFSTRRDETYHALGDLRPFRD